MFMIPGSKCKEFAQIFDKHRLYISSCNIFFQHMRMINNHQKMLKREQYVESFKEMFEDIQLQTSPLDCFVPCEDIKIDDLFIVNQSTPEYEEIQKRIPLEKVYEILPATNEIVIKLKEKPELLPTFVDDIFINFAIFKYLAKIDEIRLLSLGNIQPVINWVIENISLKELKNFLVTRKTNEEKYKKYCADIIFNPDIACTQKFYSEPHNDVPVIDVVNLMMRLSTNIVCKTDIYIIIAIYMIMTFATSDIENNNEDSKCLGYVKNVISKI